LNFWTKTEVLKALKSIINLLILVSFLFVTSSFAVTYKVKRGDTLSEIAQKYNVTVEDIIEENNLKPPYVIYKGQRLKIPTDRKNYIYYKVKKGDSLEKIARKFKVSIKTIKRANGLRRNIIRVGQILRIPKKGYISYTKKSSRKSAASGNVCVIKHKVRSGENIESIAKKYHVWVKDIKRLNNLKSNYLYAGQILCIKKSSKTSSSKKHKPRMIKEKIVKTRIIRHRVRKGESLSLISKKYNVSLNSIIRYNHLKKPYRIYAGQVLKIPKKIVKIVEIDERQKTLYKPTPIKLSFLWPVDGKIINNFVNNLQQRHLGVDIKTECGVPIKAAEEGKVIFAGDSIKAFGNLIVIRHRNKYTTVYGHVGKILIKENQWVAKGQVIGQTGKLNNSNYCGLYFEVRKDTVPINPLIVIKK